MIYKGDKTSVEHLVSIMYDFLLLDILLYFLFINIIDNSILINTMSNIFLIVFLRRTTVNPNLEVFIAIFHRIYYYIFMTFKVPYTMIMKY